MLERKLIFLDQFTSQFNGEEYEIYKFLDIATLVILTGTNLTVDTLENGCCYQCTLFYKNNKIKVRSVDKKL